MNIINLRSFKETRIASWISERKRSVRNAVVSHYLDQEPEQTPVATILVSLDADGMVQTKLVEIEPEMVAAFIEGLESALGRLREFAATQPDHVEQKGKPVTLSLVPA